LRILSLSSSIYAFIDLAFKSKTLGTDLGDGSSFNLLGLISRVIVPGPIG
jgi:hypothetical protein